MIIILFIFLTIFKGNLALFGHKMGKVKLAFNCIQRALYLGYLACGVSHPDNGTSFVSE
jgi:multisubunit Na+/H+ antiporter MnhC subunit